MTQRCLIVCLLVALLIPFILSYGCAGSASPPAIPPPTQPTQITTPAGAATLPSISVKDAYGLIQNNKNNPDFIIIDVRTADEFSSGHLSNAVNIDYYSPDFKSIVDKLDCQKEYLIYCRTGIRGEAATQIMLDLNFSKVHNLSGGIVEWISAGYLTVK